MFCVKTNNEMSYEKLRTEMLKLNDESAKCNDEIDFCIELVKEWLNLYTNTLFLGCEKNKINDFVVVLYKYNTIYLLGKSYSTIMYAPKLMFHLKSPTHLHIDDVITKYNNIGNGGILLMALFEYAKSIGVEIITGDLSSVDDEHKERRDHYYKKFGFKVGEKTIKKYL